MIAFFIIGACLLVAVGCASFVGSSLAVQERSEAFDEVVLRLQAMQAERQIHDLTVNAYAEMLDTARQAEDWDPR